MGFIFTFSLSQLSLLISVLKGKEIVFDKNKNHFPKVTIQLPIYNEKYVVERLLRQVDLIDYPNDLLEIQILDDSTDETSEIIKKTLPDLKKNFEYLTRKNREGFKAGALENGLKSASGEFIGIFDADFMPPINFIKTVIPLFSHENIGLVQSRWGHLNENFSILTKAQAFGLNAHFEIEQEGRSLQKDFINFNGTAGIWRKTTIEDAGGWKPDCLTEDLDLSYRAQNKGWKFLYNKDIVCPAELPITMDAIKSQQFRWTKGAAQCAKINLGPFLKNNSNPFGVKAQGFFHLMNSSIFVWLFLISIIHYYIPKLEIYNSYRLIFNSIFSAFQFVWLILFAYYYTSYRRTQSNANISTFIVRFFTYFILMMGLSFQNSIAVFEGWLGIKSSFIRTPKFNSIGLKSERDTMHKAKYSFVNLIELIICCYFFILSILSFESVQIQNFFYFSMLFSGYLLILYFTFKDRKGN